MQLAWRTWLKRRQLLVLTNDMLKQCPSDGRLARDKGCGHCQAAALLLGCELRGGEESLAWLQMRRRTVFAPPRSHAPRSQSRERDADPKPHVSAAEDHRLWHRLQAHPFEDLRFGCVVEIGSCWDCGNGKTVAMLSVVRKPDGQ